MTSSSSDVQFVEVTALIGGHKEVFYVEAGVGGFIATILERIPEADLDPLLSFGPVDGVCLGERAHLWNILQNLRKEAKQKYSNQEWPAWLSCFRAMISLANGWGVTYWDDEGLYEACKAENVEPPWRQEQFGKSDLCD